MTRHDLLEHALAYAAAGWSVFPLRGKVPAIPSAHRPDDPLYGKCKGGCGRDGHGVLDATTDPEWIRSRWRPGFNIGGRVPAGIVVIDTDPRHGGEANLLEAASAGGDLPGTLTQFSGRGDGGRHRLYRHPGGKLSATRLPDGVDVKTHAGYIVVAPSIHPATGRPYRWLDDRTPVAACPAWLVKLLREPPKPATAPFKPRVVRDGESVADWFTDATTWDQILTGWTEVRGGWRHPTATSPISATIRHDQLFVYSSNTPFEPTEPESPHGYTRFRAWAVLRHNGDLSAAAKAARELQKQTVAA